MEKRFIILSEKFFEKNISPEEMKELADIRENYPELNEEFLEQKRIKEVLSKMKMKNPSEEIWDKFWLSIYNRVERGIAWTAISIGVILISAIAIIQAAEAFMEDVSMPLPIKIGIILLVFGVIVLLVSIVREKLFTYKSDKYKEIQR
jgi:hypothetical protein